ncbi:MAG: AbrB/MazE/SpoVT family DNA-binding domain-containing protein [bacterium]|jgi:AbrB family looped-hinge helix DNA binding protein|nr:AbrB/MazE/SpoVT family DNA-binding domain-containing protein [bacterium]MDT8395269.1 AbrB/MazE/SpoVT family DNA-binding domain-containing protein [bacterium]
METTISTKFQVVIPKDIRRKLGLKPKQKLLVMEKAGILYMIPQAPIEDLRGSAVKAPVTGYREKDDRY